MRRCLGCMETYEDEFSVCPYCGYAVGTHADEAIHMEPGTLLADRYIVGKTVGYGGFGVTYVGWDGKLEQKVAIKEYLPSEFSTRMPGQTQITILEGDKKDQFNDGLHKFVEEAKHLAKFINEPGIVRIFDAFEENDTAYIIMEYLDGITLSEYLKQVGTVPENVAVDMLMPVMQSLTKVHAEGLLHRDIAPDNIFITKTGEIKLIDFGASRYATTSHSRSLTVIIKPGYSPEEQYRSSGDQGPHTDVYALGACLYKMITGKTPPDAMERRAKFEMQNKDILEYPHKYAKKITLVRENAILNATNVRIEDRTPDVETLIQELNSTVPVKRRNGRIRKLDIYGWPRWFKVSVAMILLALVSVGTLMATGVIKIDSVFSNSVEMIAGKVEVPAVDKMALAKAIKKVEKGKLNVAIAGSVTSEYVEAGKIVYQTPNSGMYMDENSIIYLYVSKGNGEIIAPEDGISVMPYVVGSTEEVAIKDLNTAGLANPEITYEYDENITEGLVIKQSEDYFKQLPQNSVIKLVVSKGPEPFAIADYTNKSIGDVQKELAAKGVIVETEEKENCDYPSGIVLAQSAKGGELIKKFDTITFTVSKASWSSWSTKEPVMKDGMKIETKIQYSYSDKETTTQKNNDTLKGWNLDKSETIYEDYGPFSEWSTAAVDASSTRKVESMTEYRTQQKEYTTSNSSSLAGWTQTGSTMNYTEYGSWSAWQTGPVSESDTRKIETKTQYRYQNKETTTSTTESSKSGWNQVDTKITYGDYGSFSSWSTTKPSASAATSRVIEERTTYCYFYYTCPSCGAHHCAYDTTVKWDTKCSDYGGTNSSCRAWSFPDNAIRFFDPAVADKTFYNSATGSKKYSDSTAQGRAFLHCSDTQKQYRYKDKQQITTYYYERWGSWSSWSDSPVSASSTRNVEPRTVYRYADRSKVYTYSYEKWSDWSGWSANAANASSDLKVESRVLYRYADKIPATIYTFSRWTDPTEYSDKAVTESATRKVTTRVLYRYIYE